MKTTHETIVTSFKAISMQAAVGGAIDNAIEEAAAIPHIQSPTEYIVDAISTHPQGIGGWFEAVAVVRFPCKKGKKTHESSTQV